MHKYNLKRQKLINSALPVPRLEVNRGLIAAAVVPLEFDVQTSIYPIFANPRFYRLGEHVLGALHGKAAGKTSARRRPNRPAYIKHIFTESERVKGL